MDALAALLDGPRAREAFLLRMVMSPPWSVRVQDEAPLSLVAVVRGEAWVFPDDDDAVHLARGDVAITQGPQPFTFADDVATSPQAVIHPGQHCTTPDGEELHQAMDLGVRTWGNDPLGSADLLVGTYQLEGDVSQRLLSAEVLRDEPGQEAVLDRLLDLLLIATLRAWFAGPDAEAPSWYRAHGDPVVGRALRMLHHHPAHPWTVAGLAKETGVSRAALARRFTELVGEPPMAYLTEWRLALAADLLREPDATVGSVAQQVGYGSPFALSTAFKRHRGVSPRAHRMAVT